MTYEIMLWNIKIFIAGIIVNIYFYYTIWLDVDGKMLGKCKCV